MGLQIVFDGRSVKEFKCERMFILKPQLILF